MREPKNLNDFVQIVKGLPKIGIMDFCELITFPKVKKALEFKKSKTFNIDEAILLLSLAHKDTLFYKGGQVLGNVENYYYGKNNARFKQKCDVQYELAKIAMKSRDSIQYAENFYILERIAPGKYRFINAPVRKFKEVKKERKDFIKRSRIKDEVKL